MALYENLDVEFKEIYVPEIKKEVIAFANTEGGTVYIGIRADGSIVGVEDADKVMLQAADAIRDAIRPDIMPFVQIRAIEREGKTVVEISVQTGTGRPYYLQEKGLKPSGVYVRRGSSSQPLSDEGIRAMIVQSSGRSYEEERSINQDLTFTVLQNEMSARALKLGEAQMRTLHMIGEDGLYTNLALLLSDQCKHTIKVALFQGKDNEIFRDRKEFGGSLLKQLEEVYHFIDLNNRTQATFSGLNRIDTRDYPEEAIREALLNSIVHRDYSVGGSSIVNVYEDRIEFVSLGGLVPGLAKEAIFLGVSRSRNPNLATVLYRMKLIESYGTGIGRIRRLYSREMREPVFETAEGVFRTTLPNRNEHPAGAKEVPNERLYYADMLREEQAPYGVDAAPQWRTRQDEENLILEYARDNGFITRKDVEELLEIKTTKAFLLLKNLCEDGRLSAEGSGRMSRYLPVKQ